MLIAVARPVYQQDFLPMDIMYSLASDGFIVRRMGKVVEVAVSDSSDRGRNTLEAKAVLMADQAGLVRFANAAISHSFLTD